MGKILLIIIAIVLVVILSVLGCTVSKKKERIRPFVSEVAHPEWTKNAVFYEVNIRQYTPEGTFNAFAKHLPRLKKMGVDVLWLMPVNPIGIVNRKEPLGSYYSVKDYLDTNPEFGTLDDFKKLVQKIHELGFHVIMDWVPNHSSWDNKLTVEHPDWYVKDSMGNFMPPIGTDWTDVIQFDWSNTELQDYMIEALKFWVNMGVDGFRVDHPHETPYQFWERARTELEKIKPVFMLAENEEQVDFMKKGFDMSYAWELHHLMNRIAEGKDSLRSLRRYFRKESSIFPPNVYRMVFLDNHDENSWNGPIESRMGPAQVPFAVFMFTIPGVPLIYNGQEVCLDRSLKFFEKDSIRWDTCKMTSFYKNLIKLKKDNISLWNGESGGSMDSIVTNRKNKIFAFYREKGDNRIVVFLNLSRKIVAIKPEVENIKGEYTDFFNNTSVTLPLSDSLRFDPWGYRVYVK
jgi:glycosidase